MKVPPFLGIDPIAYKSRTFQPPTNVHHSNPDSKPTAAFNPYTTTLSTIRWRNSPSGPEAQSNARILRWSDGSLTLQLATDPATQYVVNPKPLAPPQANPPKPTPTSHLVTQNRRSAAYDPKEESYTYVCAPLESAFFVRTLAKVTTSLQLQAPNQDDSIESLKASMAAIAAKYGEDMEERQKGPKIEDFKGDPTQFEKEALKLERELQKKQRKEDRDRERNVKFSRTTRTGGLTIDSLEGEGGGGGGGGGSGRPRTSRPKGPRRARRDEYSDEEDELYGRRGGPQDTYDMEDDFLVNSDEDGDEGGSEDAEGEEEDIDDIIERNERNQKLQSPKRGRDDDDTANAHASPVSRVKRRRVVDSDEE
jgi:RNA polymerase-associated protein LEO1